MSSASKSHSSPMQTKENVRGQAGDAKMPASSAQSASVKPTLNLMKPSLKPSGKEMPMSPTAPTLDRAELLGSLTTEQQQRTSARVIKKLRLDDAADRDKRDIPECDAQKLKEEEKETLKLITGKQRMPKALWSSDEKDLFFEALNEYGKDFDAITAYICAKMKKRGISSANLKTKNQVSHFYYRTWHKLSKHVHFDENVKKVAQELYALINFGELRKKLTFVQEKICGRLHELVSLGALTVRARGRNLRVRTPACRALRTLNQLTERGWEARVCGRCVVALRARDAAAWARAQAAAHNPRLEADLPLRAPLRDLLAALQRRWSARKLKREKLGDIKDPDAEEIGDDEEDRADNHLNLETDQLIVQESQLPARLALHVGPPAALAVHVPELAAGEPLSGQNICLQSYLERVKDREPGSRDQPKLRTPKRHRKYSATDKDVEQKKFKHDDEERKLMDIDETAVDGIELMASYKTVQEEHPSTEDEKLEMIEETDIGRESEREKDSFSELEDDDKYNNDSENESDQGKKDSAKFRNLKVKFRIRSKKCGGSVYTLIRDLPKEESPERSTKMPEDVLKTPEDLTRTPDVKTENKTPEDEPLTPDIEKLLTIKVEETTVLEEKKSDDQIQSEDQVKVPNDPKVVNDQTKIATSNDQAKTGDQTKVPSDQVKAGDDQKAFDDVKDDEKSEVDEEYVKKQIRKGWSVYDAGDLTMGDLYLMFGSRSRIELDYWWAEPSPPLPPTTTQRRAAVGLSPPDCRLEKMPVDKSKVVKTPEKGTDSSLEDDKERRESDTDIFSPKNVYGQDSNDGLSGDERKGDQISANDLKAAPGTLRLSSKLINRVDPVDNTARLAHMTDRLKRLLSLAGNPLAPPLGAEPAARCGCGHVCPPKKKPSDVNTKAAPPAPAPAAPAHVFRHPTPIAPKPEVELPPGPGVCTRALPPRRRGRGGRGGARGGGRAPDRHVVVQRLLPLLPKLPPANLIPVKLVPSPPQLPKLLPKPRALNVPKGHTLYILTESNGQFFFHDGDQQIPISQKIEEPGKLGNGTLAENAEVEETKYKLETPSEASVKMDAADEVQQKTENSDIASFLPSESLSLSPSRLLAGGAWLEGSDFSLSSFLGRLEGKPEMAVDSQLQSLLAESSVDFVAKFADLAAEVGGDQEEPTRDLPGDQPRGADD